MENEDVKIRVRIEDANEPKPEPKQIDWELRTWNLAVKLYTFSENTTSDASIRYAKELVEEYRKEFGL